MEELQHDLGSGCVHPVGELFERRNVGIVHEGQRNGSGTDEVYSYRAGNDDAGATLCPPLVEANVSFVELLVHGEQGSHGRHEDAVL